MNALVVDTSSWISYLAGRECPALDIALQEGQVYLPPLVVAELLSGRLRPHFKAKLLDFLRELPLCDASLDHWIRVGELRASLASKGLTISTPDAHVAQCCLDVGGHLLTEDKVFLRVAKLQPLRLVS